MKIIITKKVNMKKIYCVICGKHRKFNDPKISNIFEKTLALSTICSYCASEDKTIFKKEESIEILVWDINSSCN